MPDTMGGVDPRLWSIAGTAARRSALPEPLRLLHRTILTAFLDTGRAPERERVRHDAARHDLDPDRALAELSAADLVHLDATGTVTVAYPFSGAPTAHRVQAAGTHAVWAMCAIDALGIPQMTGRDATIRSRDPYTGDAVVIEVAAGRWQWTPAATTVLVASTSGRGPVCRCTCPHINFHAHADQARAYLGGHPELTGELLDQPTAVDLARRCFGDLLDRTPLDRTPTDAARRHRTER